MNKHNALILSAAQVPNDLGGYFGNICSGMTPLDNKPAISWIIDELLNYDFTHIYIAVDYKKELLINFVKKKYSELQITFIDVNKSLPPGNSIIKAMDYMDHAPTTIILGDTIFSERLDFNENFVLASSEFSLPEQWCLVETNQSNNVLSISDKKNITNTKEYLALIGLYHFNNHSLLLDICQRFEHNKVEISKIITNYMSKEKISVVESKSWIDLGHLDNYYKAKFRSKKTRYFNSLTQDSLLGTITKRSKDTTKFKNEINWYLNLPNQLKPLSPRIFEYNTGESPFITMEYYGYPTLSEIFLFSDLHLNTWKQILNRVFDIINLFSLHKSNIDLEHHKSIFINKTETRLSNLIHQNNFFKKIFNFDTVVINQKAYKNYSLIKPVILDRLNSIITSKEKYSCIIHGDLCFSNILTDLNSGITRLIDPRGTWGDVSIYGDIRYDLAKLRHSVSGCYDYIVNDLFDIESDGKTFRLEFFNNVKQVQIAKYFDIKVQERWNLEDIKLIEGLLFLSMIPLHSDKPKRQLAMYCQGIIILNNVIEEKNDTRR